MWRLFLGLVSNVLQLSRIRQKVILLFGFILLGTIILFLKKNIVNDNSPLQSTKENTCLYQYFSSLFNSSSAGYTFFGNKPVYLGALPSPFQEIPGTLAHCQSIKNLIALNNLNQLLLNKIHSNYHLIIPDIIPYANEELLIINEKALESTVNDQLALFQQEFGVNVNAKKIVTNLKQFQHGFERLFKNNKTLQGIVLGYGLENSITYDHKCSLLNQAKNVSNLAPLESLFLPKTPEEAFNKLKAWHHKNYSNDDYDKVFHLVNYFNSSTQNKLNIPFCYLQDIATTKKLFQEYSASQKKITALLERKKIVENVLLKLGIKYSDISQNFSPFNISLKDSEKQLVPIVIAKSLKLCFSDYILPSFLDGMYMAEKDSLNVKLELKKYLFLEGLRKQKFMSQEKFDKLSKASQFFNEIATEKNSFCLIPYQLYYKIIKKGTLKKVFQNNYLKLCCHYLTQDYHGNIINGSFKLDSPQQKDVSLLIPAIAHAIQGMSIGEIRKIYLHSNLAYGINSNIGNGMPLIITLELLDCESPIEETHPSLLQASDVAAYAPDIHSIEEFNTLQNQYAFICGYKSWQHYKKLSQLTPINTVISLLLSNHPPTFNREEFNLFLKLQIKLYDIY